MKSGLLDLKLLACHTSAAGLGSKSFIDGEDKWTMSRSDRVSHLRLDRQSDLTVFIALNTRSQSVDAGMHNTRSTMSRISGHDPLSFWLASDQVSLSKVIGSM